jgi:hypothetical protein
MFSVYSAKETKLTADIRSARLIFYLWLTPQEDSTMSSNIDADHRSDVDEEVVSEADIWRELGDLSPNTVISEAGLARLTGRHPVSIKRAVERGELPPAPRLLGQPRWTVGSLIDHLNARIQEEIKRAAITARRLEHLEP